MGRGTPPPSWSKRRVMVEVVTVHAPKTTEQQEGTPVLDVLVPTHDHLRLTLACMEALYGNTRTPFHLIVVDDSTDLTPVYFEQLKKEHDNITFIHSDIPYKCGNQIFNIGLENCKTPYMATVMNSMRVEPEWELVGLNLMETQPKVGVIGFKCLFPSGLIESAGIAMVKFLPTDIGRDFAGHRLSGVYECAATQWAFALVRKEAAVGNLTETAFHGFKGWDDIDNCFVLRKRGWRILYCGLGVGYHEPRATRGSNTLEAYHQNRENGEAFYKRWGYWEEYKKDNPTTLETLIGVEAFV